jgi:ADP-ribose pyrophosphatase
MPNSELLYSSLWLSLHRIDHWDFVKRPHSDAAVGILAITEEQEIVLVEQYRIPMQKRVIELPAGLVGDEPEFAHESLAESAGRELLEETGYAAASIKALLSSPTSSGMTSETTHLFSATGLTKTQEGGGVAGEEISVHRIPIADLRHWLLAQEQGGKSVDLKIYAALAAANVRF